MAWERRPQKITFAQWNIRQARQRYLLLRAAGVKFQISASFDQNNPAPLFFGAFLYIVVVFHAHGQNVAFVEQSCMSAYNCNQRRLDIKIATCRYFFSPPNVQKRP
jgi:hypothetical protein